MIPIVLALSTTCVVAFNNVNLLKNGNAEERFSFDGYFDRIEHGYGHKSHGGYHSGENFYYQIFTFICSFMIQIHSIQTKAKISDHGYGHKSKGYKSHGGYGHDDHKGYKSHGGYGHDDHKGYKSHGGYGHDFHFF